MAAQPGHEDIANRLLLSLPQASLHRLRPALEFVQIKRGDIIHRLDMPVDHHYFVNRGLVSLIKTMKDGRSVEIGVVGIEGVSSAQSLLGLNLAVLETVVQIPGSAFCIRRDSLQQAMEEDQPLRKVMLRYIYFAYGAVAQTAACNRLHYIEERLCRWLLIAHDNARSDTFQLTHEFLAMMLGVQRSGVTTAANALQKAGLIRYSHGQIAIIDRSGLERQACECYGAMRDEFVKVVAAAQS